PFFVLPTARSASSPTLVGLSAVSVLRRERVTVACSGCRKTRYVATRGIHRVKLRASPALSMRSATQVIVGVTAKDETGRWIVFGFAHHHYLGLGHGCMRAGVTTLTSEEAADQTTISTSCGPPSPPKTEYVYWTGTDHQVYEKQHPPGNTVSWSDS